MISNCIRVLIIFSTLLVSSAYANTRCVQNGNELTGLLGLDSSNSSVYAKTTSSSNECSCQAVRFLPQNTDTKMALSILLAAKMADKKVRIDFLQPNDCDSAFRVYIE